MNGRRDPRTLEERAAISRGMKRASAARRNQVSDLNDDVDRLLGAVFEATQVLGEAERRLQSLDAENRRLKKQLGIRSKRDQIGGELRSVGAAILREMSGPATSAYELEKLYGQRRALEEIIARLDARRQR